MRLPTGAMLWKSPLATVDHLGLSFVIWMRKALSKTFAFVVVQTLSLCLYLARISAGDSIIPAPSLHFFIIRTLYNSSVFFIIIIILSTDLFYPAGSKNREHFF